jgi:tripartite-type tricarboxylate transporter receptor subunit TctC
MHVYRLALQVLAAALLSMSNGASNAQEFPERPVRIIFPFPAGAVSDYLIRLVAESTGSELGKPVLVENRSGGAGIPGTEAGARAAPDGYTVLFVANSFASNPILRNDLPYDTDRDFQPLTLLGSTPLVLTVHASVPVQDAKQLVSLAKDRPGKLNYGAAVGASPHLAMAWFKAVSGIDVVFIPYRGQGQVQTDLLAGTLQMVFGNLNDMIPAAKAGKLRMLGIAMPKRSSLAPDVPTLAEEGFPGPVWDSFYGLVAPAQTPKAIVGKLATAFSAALQKPDVRSKMLAVGFEPAGGTPEEFKAFLEDARSNYAKTIRDANIRLQ